MLQTRAEHKFNASGRYPHVMFLLNGLSVGGSEVKIIRIANGLFKRGWKISIGYLSPNHALRDQILKGIDVVYFERHRRIEINALRKLTSYVSTGQVDVICCVNLYSIIYGYFSVWTKKNRSIKVIATINSTEFIQWIDKRKMLLYAPLLRRIDTIIFGSEYQKKLWTQRYRLDETTCTFIHNGVDLGFFDDAVLERSTLSIRSEFAIPNDALVIGSIGRFRIEKCYHRLIDTCGRLRKKGVNAYCCLVGGGVEEAKLRALVSEKKLNEYVRILGVTDDVRPFLKALDVFVLTSDTETFSNSALEAMAMSLPVVLPNVGGCPEMVKPGITGFIYEPGHLSKLVDYLILLDSDEEYRMRMGQAARQYVKENFRFESMLASYVTLLESSV